MFTLIAEAAWMLQVQVVVAHDYGPAPSDTTLDGADFSVGSTTVVWTAEDEGGTTITCAVVIEVADDEDPSVVCPDDFTATSPSDCNYTYTWPIPVPTDNCGVDTLIVQSSDPLMTIIELGPNHQGSIRSWHNNHYLYSY